MGQGKVGEGARQKVAPCSVWWSGPCDQYWNALGCTAQAETRRVAIAGKKTKPRQENDDFHSFPLGESTVTPDMSASLSL